MARAPGHLMNNVRVQFYFIIALAVSLGWHRHVQLSSGVCRCSAWPPNCVERVLITAAVVSATRRDLNSFASDAVPTLIIRALNNSPPILSSLPHKQHRYV